MDGEHSVACWYNNINLRRFVAEHAGSLTGDTDLRADLMQEAWAAICGLRKDEWEAISNLQKDDASEAALVEVARKAQETYYRAQVPRQYKPRGNKVLGVRLDAEHWYWVKQCQAKLRWPQPEVMRLIIERGAQSILSEHVST